MKNSTLGVMPALAAARFAALCAADYAGAVYWSELPWRNGGQ